jgi:hypothetical protein
LQKGFFASLFDFKFETYITKSVASVMYAILTVFVILATLIIFIYSITLFSPYSSGEAILLLLVTPLAGLLTLIVIRMGFETSIALVDIAQNTKKSE